MSFKQIYKLDTKQFSNYKELQIIAHLQKARTGESIQILKDYKNGDILIQKDQDFYLSLKPNISCLETIQDFFDVSISDIMLSSCIFLKKDKYYPHSVIATWPWGKIHKKLDMVKMQFIHYN